MTPIARQAACVLGFMFSIDGIALAQSSGDNTTTPAAVETSSRAVLDELHALPKPKQQLDLDTFKLASAHREKATSIEEKTNGLWQSWLVSVCQGCGPERQPIPYIRLEDTRAPNIPLTTGAIGRRERFAKRSCVFPTPGKYRPHVSLVSNLSDQNLRTIRCMH